MTKKHFTLIANALKKRSLAIVNGNYKLEYQLYMVMELRSLEDHFCEIFLMINKNFDRNKFKKTTGIHDLTVKLSLANDQRLRFIDNQKESLSIDTKI